jgi:hypothetical protein
MFDGMISLKIIQKMKNSFNETEFNMLYQMKLCLAKQIKKNFCERQE